MRLVFHRGPWAGREIVTGLRRLRLGSDPTQNDIVIEDSSLLASHCIIQRSAQGEYVLEDLSSGNDSHYLSLGTCFQAGASEIEVAEARPKLMQTAGGNPGRKISFSDPVLSFGRAHDNLIELADPQVSTYHAVIRNTALGLVIEDQESTNGTFVNEEKITSQILRDGDSIRMGGEKYIFLSNERANEKSESHHQDAKAHFRVLTGPQRGERIWIGDNPVVLGTAPDCDFVFLEPYVAARQCRIVLDDVGFCIEDLAASTPSSSLTFLNNKQISGPPSLLSAGDLLTIGSSSAEFHIGGGISTTFSTGGAGADPSQGQAKFVVNGHVELGSDISIGSAPACALQLDGDGINAQHCRISWSGRFEVDDSSATGTYLDDNRIVHGVLLGSHVLRIGAELLDVSVQGACCTIDRIDRSTAMAAIQIARESEFDLSKATLAPRAGSNKFSASYKTVYKVDLADVDLLVQERKEKIREGAPAWRPSSDIKRPMTIKLGVGLTILTSLLIVLFTYQHGDAPTVLINHRLSEAHSSHFFAKQAKALDITNDCGACHRTGRTGMEIQCLHCHKGFDDDIRDEHKLDDKESDAPGARCAHCHSEHSEAPRWVHDIPIVLGAAKACADLACHPKQHQGGFEVPKKPVPNAIAADAIPSFNTPLEEFHISHARVERKGEVIHIECTTCHAMQGASVEELVARDPGRSCFGCHANAGAEIERECLSCHGLEHGTGHSFTRPPKNSPDLVSAVPILSRWTVLQWALAVMAVLFLPLLILIVVVRMRGNTMHAPSAAALQVFPTESVKHLVHSINLEKCVGCRACVQACPTSVLELVNHKAQIVNFDACIQCKACELGCAFGALVMHDADKPAPTFKMPDLDRGHQTPVEGMYLIGQAAGLPQIKNACNMGRSVIERAARAGLKGGEGQAIGAQTDVLIIGSGPAGLSAALTCKRLGIQATVLEKQPEFAWTVRNFYHRGKEVMAEPEEVALVGYLPIWDTNREELLVTWETAITDNQLAIEYRQNVTNIQKVNGVFHVTVSDASGQVIGTRSAARVIIAIGGLGDPRKLGCSGDSLDKVRSALVDPSEFQDKDILVVGGTDSAIEVALSLCANNRVTLSCRTATFDRAKRRNLDLVEAAMSEGRIDPRFGTSVVSVSEGSAVLEDRHDGSQLPLANDYVFALIGGIPPTKWLEALGITYVSRAHSWSPPPSDAAFGQRQ